MKAVASRVTEKSDVLLLTPVDMEDSGPYEIAEPRVITALETYTPSCKFVASFRFGLADCLARASNTATEKTGGDCVGASDGATREARAGEWGDRGIVLYIRHDDLLGISCELRITTRVDIYLRWAWVSRAVLTEPDPSIIPCVL